MSELAELSLPIRTALLALSGIAGGFVNTLAGGGSFVMVPALMLLGLPADLANASSRVSIVAQTFTGAAAYARAGQLHRAQVADVVPPTLVGALLGAYVATILPNSLMEPLLIGTFSVMAVTMLINPGRLVAPPGAVPVRTRDRVVIRPALFAAGFYGGILQAGAGIILLGLLGGVLRYDLIRGNALKVVIVFSYTLVALAVFIVQGKIVWIPALILTAGNVIGAWLGVHFALTRGQTAVKRVVFLMVILLCVAVVLR